MQVTIMDFISFCMSLLLLFLAYISYKESKKVSMIIEFRFLTLIYLIATFSSITDILARLLYTSGNSALLTWKLSQMATQLAFLIMIMFALRIMYDKPPFLVTEIVSIFIFTVELILASASRIEVVNFEAGEVTAINGVTEINGVILHSGSFQIFTDIWQIFCTFSLLIAFILMYKQARNKEMKKNLLLQVIAVFIIFFMACYEFLEAFFLPNIPGAVLIFIGLILMSYVYLRKPTSILLSPVGYRNLIVIDRSGIPLLSVEFSDKNFPASISAALISGTITAINEIFKSWTKFDFKEIVTEELTIVAEHRKNTMFLLTTDKPTKMIKTSLKYFAEQYCQKYDLCNSRGGFSFNVNDNFTEDKQLIQESFPCVDPEKIVPLVPLKSQKS